MSVKRTFKIVEEELTSKDTQEVLTEFAGNVKKMRESRDKEIRSMRKGVSAEKEYEPFQQLASETIDLLRTIQTQIVNRLAKVKQDSQSIIERRVDELLNASRVDYPIKISSYLPPKYNKIELRALTIMFERDRNSETPPEKVLFSYVNDKVNDFYELVHQKMMKEVNSLGIIRQELKGMKLSSPEQIEILKLAINRAKKAIEDCSKALEEKVVLIKGHVLEWMLKGLYQISKDRY